MGMELLMQRLVIGIALAVVHGLSFAEPLSEHPLSSSPQRGAFAPCTLTFPRRLLFSEPRGASISPREPGIANRPPLFSPTGSPPLLPIFFPNEKIPISPPTLSASSPTVSPRKKMKPRSHPITAAVIPASPLLREPPLLSPLTKHPAIPRFRYSRLNSNEWPLVSIPLTPQPVQKHQGIRSKIHNEAHAPSFTHHHRSLNPGTVYPPPHPKKTHPKQNFRLDYALTSNHDNNYVPTPALISAPNQRGIVVPFVPYASPPKTTPESPIAPPVVSPLPPTKDCSTFVCMEPFTSTLPGTPCGCVQPVQVGLRFNVSLYTFFPLGKNLTEQIAAGVLVKQNQVRIMGVDASTQKPEETIVIIDVVPVGAMFDTTAALLIYNKFWNKNVVLGNELGNYDVLYVRYPGLPPPPPTSDSDLADIIGSRSGQGNYGVTEKPLGADVSKSSHIHGLSSPIIAIVVLSASVAVILITATAWLVMFQCRHVSRHSDLPPLLPSHIRQSDVGSGLFASCIAANIGSAKIFSYAEVQKATDNFDASKIVGEGGFGCVYSGVLQDGTHIAVKVLKRDDDHGDREFMAEVEVLGRLHHRHLVKLIGICIEAHNRCLIYELVPNGSVESHLHGQDKERSPLDWVTRLKIALGAARALAYLHEDSNPRVIHRDFKSSNILLEDDFTPKVSDFGLARTGIEEKNGHISTRVMGTFGYVAPEYAMTGHLLVKSDVYSYGVVLLELLTGRKPVDMSQPPGQENLVTWARPLLTSMEGLESVLDKSLTPFMSYDSAAKVAAIASLCVQPEVSLRPYMGEVVQALKLLYDQCGDCASNINYGNTGSSSQFSIPLNLDYPTHNLNSEFDMDEDLCISISEPSNGSPSFFLGRSSVSFRRHSTSGPVTISRKQFWRRIKLSF